MWTLPSYVKVTFPLPNLIVGASCHIINWKALSLNSFHIVSLLFIRGNHSSECLWHICGVHCGGPHILELLTPNLGLYLHVIVRLLDPCLDGL